MIKLDETTVFISTPNYDYETVKVNTIPKNKRGLFSLSLHTTFESFNLVPIDHINKDTYTGTMMVLEVINSCGIKRQVQITPSHRVYTRFRGYVSANKLNLADVLVDENGYDNKITSREYIKVESMSVFEMSTRYHSNFVANGIVVRSK